MSNDDDKIIDQADSRATSLLDRKPSPRKPYHPPVLLEWGAFEELTQASGNRGKNDGGHRPFRKTR
ncbi:MAG: lasso RiPP family leader peptide-containing protein [Proteobacteria bacterium]|nr:lasso RiPP family leader peptide-containing protein [Pseudomonadota bacterium]